MALWKHSLRNIFPGHRGAIESGLLSGQPYAQKVLDYGPIAYWPLWEAAGPTAECLVNPAQNGTYTGVTLGQPGIGDGNTSPFFDGVNDYVSVLTAALIAAWDGTAGSMMIWGRVNAGAVWTDGATRDYCYFNTDANNSSYFRKNAANNEHRWRFTAGGVGALFNQAAAMTDWHCMQMTWGGGNNNYYLDGILVNGPNAIGVWAGPLGTAMIGAFNAAPLEPWHGWLAHCVIWDTPLTQPQMAELATV